MKTRRLILIAGSLVFVASLLFVALVTHWEHSAQTFKNLPKIVLAAETYSRDKVAHGQPLPASVSLRDLVASRYVSTEDVREFDGMDVTVYPTTNDTDPQSILIRVRMPDGSQIAAMGDGSIQALPR